MNLTQEQMIDMAHKSALKTFEQGGDPDSAVYIHRRDRPWDVMKLDYSGKLGMPPEMNRKLILMAISKLRISGEFGGCVFLGNAWYALAKATSEKELVDEVRPSQRPDRREGLFIIAWDVKCESSSRAFDIVRDDKNKFVKLAPKKSLEEAGHYKTMLDPAFTTPEKILGIDGEKGA